MPANLVVGVVLAALVALFVGWKCATTSLLKDPSDAPLAPYSFSRSQLAWWTTIIGACIAGRIGLTGELPVFNDGNTILILLGISAGTTGVATILDQRQDQASALSGVPRSQDAPSQGWLDDVLSDNNGPSVHRLQVLVFNAIYGMLYVYRLIASPGHAFPVFDSETLILLGISASTYGYMKSTENQGQPAPAAVSEAVAVAAAKDSGWVG